MIYKLRVYLKRILKNYIVRTRKRVLDSSMKAHVDATNKLTSIGTDVLSIGMVDSDGEVVDMKTMRLLRSAKEGVLHHVEKLPFPHNYLYKYAVKFYIKLHSQDIIAYALAKEEEADDVTEA